MKIFGKTVAIEVIKTPTKAGSLYLPTNYQKRTREAIVRLVGDEETELKVGDRVLWDDLDRGDRLMFDDTELILLQSSSIMAKIETDEKE